MHLIEGRLYRTKVTGSWWIYSNTVIGRGHITALRIYPHNTVFFYLGLSEDLGFALGKDFGIEFFLGPDGGFVGAATGPGVAAWLEECPT